MDKNGRMGTVPSATGVAKGDSLSQELRLHQILAQVGEAPTSVSSKGSKGSVSKSPK